MDVRCLLCQLSCCWQSWQSEDMVTNGKAKKILNTVLP